MLAQISKRSPRCAGSEGRSATIAVLVFLWGLTQAAGATEQGPVFRTLSVNDGLPDRRVESIVQDAQGFIWIGTQGGLARYEGERLRLIPSDPEVPNPLPGHNIMSMLAHSDGTVWVAVENRGVVQIAPDLDLRRHLEPETRGGRLPAADIWSLAEGCDGRVWMAFMRGGVAVYDPASNGLTTYDQSERAGLSPDGFQVDLEVDSSCKVWLVQTGRISTYDPDDDRFHVQHQPSEGRIALHLSEVRGRIYFNEGGYLYDFGPTESAAAGEPVSVAVVKGPITAVAADPHSEQIVIGATSGLYRKLPGPSSRLRRIHHVPGLAHGLPSDSIDGLLFDREGGLWLTTTRSGAAYLPPGFAAFGRYQPMPGGHEGRGLSVEPVISLAWDDRARGFWVGGQDSEVAFLPADQGSETVPVLSEAARDLLFGSSVVGLIREGDTLYVALQKELIRIDLGDQGGQEVLLRRNDLESGTFARLWRKDADRFWILTEDAGVIAFDEQNSEREHFYPEGRGRNHLPENAPTDMLRDGSGRWWLLAPGGLYLWDETGGFILQPVASGQPLVAAAWQGSDLWLATEKSLQRWQRQDERVYEKVDEVSVRGRLPPGRIMDLLIDQKGGLWLLRSSGLSLYRPDQRSLRHLSRRDGLAAVEFGKNAAVSLPDGRLAFGGKGGIVTVDPEQLSRVTVPPMVHISRLEAGDYSIEFGPAETKAVELEHDHNNLAIEFLATSYLAQEHMRYRVKLEGWDQNWVELIGQTRHHYSSLPSGRYRFRVQAAAPDGPWSEEADTLPVVIEQPPWLSAWALSAYVLLAVTGAGVGLRGYRRAHQRRREMHEARQKRVLAEEQRKIMTRLNGSLEPMSLAETIAQEVVHVTSGRLAWLGYVDEHLPRELACSDPDLQTLTRDQWRQHLEQAAFNDDQAITLRVAEREVARVLVESPAEDLTGESRERLRLLEEMAGQVLHNALLLQRVRALAERAEQANNAKSEFLATMSHEIRTPLHGVLGMVELLYETETEPGQQDILDTLRQSGLQLQRIIDDVLDISRIEAGRMSLNAQPFDLAAMLEQVVDLHAPNAARKGLDLRLRVAANLPLVATGDSDRLSQVLGNLLSNAVKFTECGGIELSVAVGGDGYLVLVVSDSGPGIGKKDRERLFEPFTQLDASITRSYSGSGLGLAICRRLVDAMGGTLDLLEGCHAGSRFRVRLPVLDASVEDQATGWSNLLEGQRVAASVRLPTLRVLRGLARRWGIQVIDVHNPPRSCDLLLVDPQTLDETDAERLDQWRHQAQALAWLQSPFPSHSGPPPMLPEGAHFLRWPLVESRFVGLLFDLRIGNADGRPSSE